MLSFDKGTLPFMKKMCSPEMVVVDWLINPEKTEGGAHSIHWSGN